jgi:hypothetical protein
MQNGRMVGAAMAMPCEATACLGKGRAVRAEELPKEVVANVQRKVAVNAQLKERT